MPEFYPNHDMPNLNWLSVRNPDFLRGYLGCAEWLLHTEGHEWECGCTIHYGKIEHVKTNDADMAKCANCGMRQPNGYAPIDRASIKGWTRKALRAARDDCDDFVAANTAYLEKYSEESGRGMNSAGHDFWLSRNGHGAGFFDRGNDPVFRRLQEAAKVYRECDVEVWRNRLCFL